MNSKRFSGWTASLAEVLATLGGTIALTLAATVTLTAVVLLMFPGAVLRAEVPLHQLSINIETPMSHEDLILRLQEEGVARNIQIISGDPDDEVPRLVLEGVNSQGNAEFAVQQALGAGGYRLAAIEFLPLTDPAAMVTNLIVLIPAMLIQACVFILIGGAMIWWRVMPTTLVPSNSALTSLGVGLGGGVVAVVISVSMGKLLELVGLPVTEQPILQELLADPNTLLKLAPWIVVAMPIAEEVFFRGYVFRFLTNRISFPAGILWSSFLFAVVHMNISGFLVYVALGMIFAVAYRKTSSLLTPITAHVTYNGLLVLGMFLGV